MTSLSGEWHGIFNYPSQFPPTEFTATVVDIEGQLSGTIAEVDNADGNTATATIQGHLTGNRVAFTKFYDDISDHRDTVLYGGDLSSDGNEIGGRWTIPGDWSGTFIMVRPAQEPAAAALETAEPIETEA